MPKRDNSVNLNIRIPINQIYNYICVFNSPFGIL